MKDYLKKHWLTILILFVASMVVLALSLYHRAYEPTLGRDSVNYIGIIRIWHETGSIDGVLEVQPDFWFPFLSLYLGKVLVDCGFSAEGAAVGMNIFFACFLPLIIFGIANEITQNKKLALCSAVLLSFNPTVIELAVEAQRDMPYLFFCGLMIFFACCAIRREKWYFWGVTGICFAFSLLIRYETLEMVPVFACYFLAVLIFRKGKRIQNLCHCMILASAGILALALLLWISGTTDYVQKQYYSYYEGKYSLMQEKLGDLYE